MITKQHKMKAVADIKRGNVTSEVARVMRCTIPMIERDDATINDVKYDRKTFDEIVNYLQNVLKVQCIYFEMV